MRALIPLGGLLLILWIVAWRVLKVAGFFIRVLPNRGGNHARHGVDRRAS